MNHKYSLKPPSPDLLNELTNIVGHSYVLREGDPNQSRYLKEWRDRYIGRSELILRPSNSAEISAILKRCNEEHVGVVPQSGNTGLVGGQIPHESGTEIVISLDRMTKIKNLDLIGKSIEVEAGVTLAATQQAALSSDLLLPLSIASEGSACIGGNLATNVGGSSVVAYGSIRHLTLGLEVVLADGRIWS
ncbi:MAG: FAD-binding oxidoreductase, partial [Hyphomicrobium sp.]